MFHYDYHLNSTCNQGFQTVAADLAGKWKNCRYDSSNIGYFRPLMRYDFMWLSYLCPCMELVYMSICIVSTQRMWQIGLLGCQSHLGHVVICRTVMYLSHGLTMITSCHGSVFGKTGPLYREISGSSSKRGKLRWALMFSMVLAYMSCWPNCRVSVDSKYNAMATIQLTPI